MIFIEKRRDKILFYLKRRMQQRKKRRKKALVVEQRDGCRIFPGGAVNFRWYLDTILAVVAGKDSSRSGRRLARGKTTSG